MKKLVVLFVMGGLLLGCAPVLPDEKKPLTDDQFWDIITLAPIVAKLFSASQDANEDALMDLSARYGVDVYHPVMDVFAAAHAVIQAFKALQQAMIAPPDDTGPNARQIKYFPFPAEPPE